ncbi:MAG: hypothetical protein L3J24_09925 [Xanthomonadales bacterium]|nr:hypothetical protein [Xanthomonadales bacterium]
MQRSHQLSHLLHLFLAVEYSSFQGNEWMSKLSSSILNKLGKKTRLSGFSDLETTKLLGDHKARIRGDSRG